MRDGEARTSRDMIAWDALEAIRRYIVRMQEELGLESAADVVAWYMAEHGKGRMA